MGRLAVPDSPDLARVFSLPSRVLDIRDAEAWAEVFTQRLRLPRGDMTLDPWQGQALAEVKAMGGGVLGMPVGIGKTLIAFLLATIFDFRSMLFIAPKALEDQWHSMAYKYSRHWQSPKVGYEFLSRSALSCEGYKHYLHRMKPRLIVADECHDLSNFEKGAANRLWRYRWSPEGRDCVMVFMSGTPIRKSLMNVWHLMLMALGENAPVPLRRGEAQLWAKVIDYKPREVLNGILPGPLGSTKTDARAKVAKRFRTTRGLLLIDGDTCDQPLTIRVRYAREDTELDGHFKRLGRKEQNPAGIPVTDPLQRWRLDALLGCGLYEQWDPEPPEAWREAFRGIARFSLAMIRRSRRRAGEEPLDTMAEVIRRYRHEEVVQNWLQIKPTFKGKTKPIWVSASTVASVLDWLRETDEPSLVWCGSIEFGRVLAKTAGLVWYGSGGLCEHGTSLLSAPPGRSLVVSWNSAKQGFNLQAWRRHLVVFPPQSARYLEQLLGRGHRKNQTRPVEYTLLATSGGSIDMLAAAGEESDWGESLIGMTQKLRRAKVVYAKEPRATRTNGYRWGSRKDRDD